MQNYGFLIVLVILAIAVFAVLFQTFFTVDQGKVAVITAFGKYRRAANPGLHAKIPFVERVYSNVAIQNQTNQLQFSAITEDQAAVHFTATIIYTAQDHTSETVQLVAFKFVDQASFQTAMTSAVEASVRQYVATKKQAEVLGVRGEIVGHAKETLDEQLSSWGYLLVDLTVNDIRFDDKVMASMTKVVAAKNEKTAAEFEGDALLVRKTKEAEAQGAFIRIGAENEATAAKLRGQGLADFRKAIAEGLSESAEVLKAKGVDPTLIAFAMWTETVRDAAREGQGNVIFLDGSPEGMEDGLRRLQGLTAIGSGSVSLAKDTTAPDAAA